MATHYQKDYLTDERFRVLLEVVERVGFGHVAAATAGISQSCLQNWLAKGRREIAKIGEDPGLLSKYGLLVLALRGARARTETRLLDVIMTHALGGTVEYDALVDDEDPNAVVIERRRVEVEPDPKWAQWLLRRLRSDTYSATASDAAALMDGYSQPVADAPAEPARPSADRVDMFKKRALRALPALQEEK